MIESTILPLLMLAIPIACISWTVTHEEVFREFHEYCLKLSRKFFFLFTCEYCFSHYVSIFFLFLTRYTIFFADWRGYLIAFFSLVFVANIYMSLFGKIRIDIKKDVKTIEKIEQSL